MKREEWKIYRKWCPLVNDTQDLCNMLWICNQTEHIRRWIEHNVEAMDDRIQHYRFLRKILIKFNKTSKYLNAIEHKISSLEGLQAFQADDFEIKLDIYLAKSTNSAYSLIA